MKLEWEKATELVRQAGRILVLTHVGPDGDAIGSMMGLAHTLRDMGKHAITAVDGGTPDDLAFIPGSPDAYAELRADQLAEQAIDLVIAVDCGDEPRMGKVGQVALQHRQQHGVPLINLDHHRTNTLFGDANLVDPATVAAAEGVLDWLDYLGVEIEPRTAFCLLTGIVTDTLCFRTNNVTADTFGKVQRLMNLDAPLSEIVQQTVNRSTYAALRLTAAVLPTVQLEDHVIWAVITHDLYHQADYPIDDDAGLVSRLVQTEEAYISAVFKQKRNGSGIEIGFRAVPGFDTATVAVELGGGGHMLASGATVQEPLETLVPRVIAMLKDEVQRGSPLVK